MRWLTHSPYLSPSDYFLWGYVKAKVYKYQATSIGGQKAAIQQKNTARNNLSSNGKLQKSPITMYHIPRVPSRECDFLDITNTKQWPYVFGILQQMF